MDLDAVEVICNTADTLLQIDWTLDETRAFSLRWPYILANRAMGAI